MIIHSSFQERHFRTIAFSQRKKLSINRYGSTFSYRSGNMTASSLAAPGPVPALQETRPRPPAGTGTKGGARRPSAHLRLPPRPAAAGHGRCLSTRALKQNSPVWRPDRAQTRAAPTAPPVRRAVGAAWLAQRSTRHCERQRGTPATAKVSHGSVCTPMRCSLSGFAVRLRRGTVLTVFTSQVRVRGDQFLAPVRILAGRHAYPSPPGAAESTELLPNH